MSRAEAEQLEAAFAKAYAALNDAQRQAVDTIEGPVLVVAGPGTGKTQILTLRIVNILRQTDVRPEQILALTFTESGARAMRDRLRQYLGSVAYQVPIFTFHGFAGQLVAQYPEAYPRLIGGRVARDLERIAIIESILTDAKLHVLRPAGNPQFYVTAIMRTLSTLKQENYIPDDLRQLVETQVTQLAEMPQYHEQGVHAGKVRGEYLRLEKTVAKNQALVQVYQQYQASMDDAHWYDYDDMLIETVRALSAHDDMLRDLQETYQYLLADEHQDVNGAQNAILEHLARFHERPNLFAVGDEKQAIYRFQGASLENFLQFTDTFPDTTVIALTENYRSGQTILDSAHSLVAVTDGPLKDLRVPLQAAAVPSARVMHATFSHHAIEDEWLVDTVADSVAKSTQPEAEVAVIVRTNREVEHVTALLRARGITVQASADGDILDHPITLQVQQLLRATLDPSDQAALARVVAAPYWNITVSDRMRVLAAQRYNHTLTDILADIHALQQCGVEDTQSVQHVHTTLEAARAAAVHQPPHRVLQQLLQMSGFVSYVETNNPLEGVRVLRRLYDEVENIVREQAEPSLASVAYALTQYRQYQLPFTAPYVHTAAAAVQVMTAHKSKGLEFATVFLPYLIDRSWGGGRRPEHFKLPLVRASIREAVEPLDDERRLLFVAMTRAKEQLYLTSSTITSTGAEASVSRLVTELDPATLTKLDTTAVEATFQPTERLAVEPTRPTIDTELVGELFLTRGFSATSLNNYLTSPWKFVAKNLLRLPEVQALPLLYGTAVHNVLERVTRAYTTDRHTVTPNELAHWVQAELSRLPLGVHEYTQLHERALAALVPYCECIIPSLPPRTREELSLSVTLTTDNPICPEIPLTGKLDRLDCDEAGSALRVIDYKTGKPKSRNAIIGATKQSDGSYKRQLVFYALLLELYGVPELQTRDMVLSFVEPTQTGNVREETFTITDAEINSLKEEIIAAGIALVSGEWTHAPCDQAETEICQLFAPPSE